MADSKDKQSNKFLLTINNPNEKGLTHDKIKEICTMNFTTFSYLAMADEKGSTYHTHVFIYFKSRVRFSKVKKSFPEAHIDICKGLVSDNVNYIKKSGKWKNTDKSETSIPDTFEEMGIKPPDSRGKDDSMTQLYQMVCDGYSTGEIIAENQDYIYQLEKIDKVRFSLLMDKYKDSIREDLKVIYISGATGTGKTSGILKEHSASNVYRVTDYQHPFDGYNCQPVICFDEFRSSLCLKDMLNYCDIYPLQLPARYSNKIACYNTVYIISNWELERQYSEIQKDDELTWRAFLRRISKVRVFKGFNDVVIYNSPDEYFARKREFEAIPDNDKSPFD